VVRPALDNLARIVQDNIAAQMVFSSGQDVADALKSKEDLLSTEILAQPGGGAAVGTAAFIKTAAAGAGTTSGCPVLHA
jgi:hypothetical protein